MIEPASAQTDRPFLLSVVVPCFNEAAVLATFHQRLVAALSPIGCRVEIIYVNDGSADTTLEVLHAICRAGDDAGFINLSRNFGKRSQ